MAEKYHKDYVGESGIKDAEVLAFKYEEDEKHHGHEHHGHEGHEHHHHHDEHEGHEHHHHHEHEHHEHEAHEHHHEHGESCGCGHDHEHEGHEHHHEHEGHEHHHHHHEHVHHEHENHEHHHHHEHGEACGCGHDHDHEGHDHHDHDHEHHHHHDEPIEISTHEDSIIATVRMGSLGRDKQAARVALRSFMTAVAEEVEGLGGMIGHIKFILKESQGTMYSMTDLEEIQEKPAEGFEYIAEGVCIVLGIEPEKLEEIVHGHFPH